jgi:hypothetical protein
LNRRSLHLKHLAVKKRVTTISKISRRGWLAKWLQKRRRKRAPAILLTSDGHGRLSWTINFIPQCDDSQPNLPYNTIEIYRSDDGVTWSGNGFDGGDLYPGHWDGSGLQGYFRISIVDWGGYPVPPYSNVVYSDGL